MAAVVDPGELPAAAAQLRWAALGDEELVAEVSRWRAAAASALRDAREAGANVASDEELDTAGAEDGDVGAEPGAELVEGDVDDLDPSEWQARTPS